MLSKIHLRHFKKFKNVEVTLRPFTILMGENNSGKTTILQAINVALQSLYDLRARNSIRVKNDGSEVIYDGKGMIYYIDQLPSLNISRVGELYYGGKTSPETPALIELTEPDGNIYRLQIQSSFGIKSRFGNFNFKCISSSGDFKVPRDILLLSQPLLISGFAGLNTTEERKFPKAILDRVQSGRMSEIIRNLILDIKGQIEGNVYEHFSRLLSSHFQFNIDTIKFDEMQDNYITASFSEIRDGQRFSFNLNSSGSGLLQVLQILAPIYRFASKGTVVLLDEPDAHLHTNLQYTLAQALREVQRELNIQIIISTHSIPMIEAAEPYEVVPVHAQMQHIEPLEDKVDVDVAISKLIDNFHLAKAKISGKLVFIEDADIDALKGFDRALGTGCFQGLNTVPFDAGGGKDNKAPYSSKRTLQAYTKRDIEVHFIVDGDAMPDKWRKCFMEHAKDKFILHQLVRHEIENYLINPDLLVRALRVKYPRKEIPDAEELRSVLTDIMKETMVGPRAYFKDHIKSRLEQLALNKEIKEIVLNKETNQEEEIKKFYSIKEVEREARNIADKYYDYSEFDQLIIAAPGKDIFTELNKWLTAHGGMNISVKAVASCITREDVPEEIEQLLMQLRSNAVESSGNEQQKRQSKKKD